MCIFWSLRVTNNTLEIEYYVLLANSMPEIHRVNMTRLENDDSNGNDGNDGNNNNKNATHNMNSGFILYASERHAIELNAIVGAIFLQYRCTFFLLVCLFVGFAAMCHITQKPSP